MHDSAEISQSFYRDLGASGLAAQTEPDWDRVVLGQLTALLEPGERVADIGCGYGRLAIPLALRGFRVTGLDLSTELLSVARASAEEVSAEVDWHPGNMCRMPLESGAFDAVICMWSAFYELLNHDEQMLAVREMHRILRPGGWTLVDGPLYFPATDEELASGARRGPRGCLAAFQVQGLTNMHFCHNEKTLSMLMREADIRDYRAYAEVWDGRVRQHLWFRKDAAAQR